MSTTVIEPDPAAAPVAAAQVALALSQGAAWVGAQWAGLAILTILGLVVAWRGGVLRPGSAVGPERLPAGAAGGGLFAPWLSIVFAGAIVWVASQAVYGAVVAERASANAAPATSPTPSRLPLSAADLAILSTVPPFLGAGVMLGAGAASAPGLIDRIGFSLARFPQGLKQAALAFCFAYPLVVWVLIAMERAYRAAGFEHPRRHELLERLGEAPSPIVQVGIVTGAVVAAPLFEELLFRGGVQTLLRSLFTRAPRPTDPPANRAASPAAVWGAIAVTSVLFTLIHATWMAPAIFVLSVCLGYLYERTGNLWSAVLLHAAFNAAMTIFSMTT